MYPGLLNMTPEEIAAWAARSTLDPSSFGGFLNLPRRKRGRPAGVVRVNVLGQNMTPSDRDAVLAMAYRSHPHYPGLAARRDIAQAILGSEHKESAVRTAHTRFNRRIAWMQAQGRDLRPLDQIRRDIWEVVSLHLTTRRRRPRRR